MVAEDNNAIPRIPIGHILNSVKKRPLPSRSLAMATCLATKIIPTVSSVKIGRGVLHKPWIIQEIKEQRHIDMTSSERSEIMRKYVNYGLDHWGSDTKDVENNTR